MKGVGIGLLVAIALCPLQRAYVVLPMCLLRTWLMNAPLALSKSVLNDYVPKRHRAKWSSLEAINTSTWAGSAALGGLLSDHIGYRHTFLVTAGLQAVGLLLYVPLASLVVMETTAVTPSTTRPKRTVGAPSMQSSTNGSQQVVAPLAAPLLGGAGGSPSRHS